MENRIVYCRRSVIKWFNYQAEPYQKEGEEGRMWGRRRRGYTPYTTRGAIAAPKIQSVRLLLMGTLGPSISSSVGTKKGTCCYQPNITSPLDHLKRTLCVGGDESGKVGDEGEGGEVS